MPQAQISLYSARGEKGANKPLPALDLAFNLAKNCRAYYNVTERHHVSVQLKSKAPGGFLPCPPLIASVP